MKIVSNFHDYYDSIQGTIFDKDVIYLRKEVGIGPWESWKYNRYFNYGKDSIIVGFAGKIYRGLRCVVEKRNIIKYLWSWDKAKEFLDEHKFDYTIGPYYDYERVSKDWFGEVNIPQHKELFFKYNVPIFGIGFPEYDIILNPCLKNVDFAKILEPYTAFQQLYQYMCNQASPEKPIPAIDDKTLAEAKGFDKFSFRKEKSKK